MTAHVRWVCLAAAALTTLPAAELPVRQVVLYKHGVGYIERSGSLGSGESARLDFKASEMNDVLKSLTVEEKGGGKITGLRYDSSQPIAEKLAEFPFAIGDGTPVAALLDQFKGARVELRTGSEPVAGALVGARVMQIEEKLPQRESVTVLTDSGDLRTVDLATLAAIRFPDPALQKQFKEYLAAVAGGRSKERRSVYLDSTGASARQLAVSYMIPTPVWKSSYRLIFDRGPQPTLEGWAIVDNTTGEDWTNVQLSLVSGKPISFISKLYEPRYVQRPEAELPEEQAQAPVVHRGDVRQFSLGGLFAKKAAPPPPPPPAAAAPRMMMSEAIAERAEIASSIAATAAGREAGELFEYKLPQPVTVRKSESAMLPFLQQKIDARKLLIYADSSSEHPTNAAELVNNSGKTLDGGPVTVFDGGVYGGEALMETLKSGDKRLISYAVDLGTRITAAFDSTAAVIREFHLRRGVLTARTAMAETRTLSIRNVDAKAKTLIVEHPVRPGYTLLGPKPGATTANAYRFEVKLAPASDQKLAVNEERVYDSTTVIANLTPDILVSYTQNKALTDAGRRQLEQILDRKRQIAAAETESRQAEADTQSLFRDQERIRQNLISLNQVSGQQQQVQVYARQLADQEAEVAKLRDRAAAAKKRKAALEAELNALVEKLEF